MLRSGFIVLGVTLATALRLAPEAIAITWDAPASCPDAEYLRQRISEHLRGVEVEATDVRARVLAPAVAGARWRLQLAIGDEGQRELEGESCAALADAAAVMVAISLNAAAQAAELTIPEPPPEAPGSDVVRAEPSEPDAVPAAVPASAAAPAEPAEPGPSPIDDDDAVRSSSAGRPLQAVLGVTTAAHGVGLPAPGVGLGGRVGVRWGPLVVALVGTHWFRRERPVVGEVAARYRLSTAGLEPCGVLALGRSPRAFEPFACGVAEVGVLRAEGVRAVSPKLQRHPWVGLGAGVGAAWVPRAWLAVSLRVDVVAPLLGRQFVIGSASAGAVGPVDARGAITLELRVPRIVRSR